MHVIKAYKTRVQINDLVKEVLVTIEAELEAQVDYDGLDDTLINEVSRDLENNTIKCFYLQVRADFTGLDGFTGLDSIGQVFTRGSSENTDLVQSAEIYSMAENAINDLVAQVLQGVETINNFLDTNTKVEYNGLKIVRE